MTTTPSGASHGRDAALPGEQSRRADEPLAPRPWMGQRGYVRYLRRSTGAERGRESFVLTQAANGSRTVRSVSEMDDVQGGILRDVTFTVGPDWRPRQAYTRLEAGGAYHGAGWTRVEGNVVHAHGHMANRGAIEQRTTVPDRFAMIFHPVVLDAWQFPSAYDRSRGGEQRWTAYDVSPGGAGYDGPLGWLHPNSGVFLGEEEIRVPAGTFRCERYRILPDAFEPIDLWVTGPHLLLVLMDWAGFDARYELTSLQDL